MIDDLRDAKGAAVVLAIYAVLYAVLLIVIALVFSLLNTLLLMLLIVPSPFISIWALNEDRLSRAAITAAYLYAVATALVWLAIIVGFFATSQGRMSGSSDTLIFVLTHVLPLALSGYVALGLHIRLMERIGAKKSEQR